MPAASYNSAGSYTITVQSSQETVNSGLITRGWCGTRQRGETSRPGESAVLRLSKLPLRTPLAEIQTIQAASMGAPASTGASLVT